MVRRFYTLQEVSDGVKRLDDEISKAFFKGETNISVKSLEMKHLTSFYDNTVYVHYELSVGYERPVIKV